MTGSLQGTGKFRPCRRLIPAGNSKTFVKLKQEPSQGKEGGQVRGHAPRYCVAATRTCESRRIPRFYDLTRPLAVVQKLWELRLTARSPLYERPRYQKFRGFSASPTHGESAS